MFTQPVPSILPLFALLKTPQNNPNVLFLFLFILYILYLYIYIIYSIVDVRMAAAVPHTPVGIPPTRIPTTTPAQLEKQCTEQMAFRNIHHLSCGYSEKTVPILFLPRHEVGTNVGD